jgi:outer membrane protein OmpU
MNIKKIGMTALAASLVSVSAHAGAMSVTGGASVNIGGYSGERQNNGTSFTMANQVTVSGGGELDNGLNVSLSFQLDNGETVFDDHSLTISSDEIGTIKFSGHGGSSATSSIDGTVAGDIWDGFNSAIATGTTGQTVSASAGENNSIFYTLPEVMEGVSLFASYNPQVAGSATSNESELGYGITYTGVEGLTASYATMDENTGTTGTSGEQTAWKVTYAYGPVTVGMSNNDYDVGSTGTDQETDSYSVAYTVSDELSISYGVEEISTASLTKSEYSAIVAAYTAGGMTLTGKLEEAENVAGGTGSVEDQEYWMIGAAFAF